MSLEANLQNNQGRSPQKQSIIILITVYILSLNNDKTTYLKKEIKYNKRYFHYVLFNYTK